MKILTGVLLLFGSIYLVASGYILALVFIASLVVLIAAHEAGHAYFMRKHGVEIKEFGIGIGKIGKQLFYIKAKQIRLPFLKADIPPIAFHPLLIGAYVQETEEGTERIKALPLKARLQIFGGGVYVNLLFAIIIYALIQVSLAIFVLLNGVEIPFDIIQNTVIATILVAILIKWRYALSIWSPIIMGIFMIILLWVLFSTPGATEAFIGPIAVITTGASIGTNSSPTAIFELMLYVFAISLSLGLTNSLPIPPLDGGHMATAILKRFRVPDKILSAYRIAGLTSFVVFIIFVIVNDIYKLFIR